ncbi:unnamed protein product [Amaranthus hypochondriacus]
MGGFTCNIFRRNTFSQAIDMGISTRVHINIFVILHQLQIILVLFKLIQVYILASAHQQLPVRWNEFFFSNGFIIFRRQLGNIRSLTIIMLHSSIHRSINLLTWRVFLGGSTAIRRRCIKVRLSHF